MTASPTRSSGRQYLAYGCLLCLFATAVTNQIRTVADAFANLRHGREHVRGPFTIDGLEMKLASLKPEARAAGTKDGDLLLGVSGRAAQGFTDLYSVLRHARPGERLRVRAGSSTPGIHAPRDISITLQPLFPNGAQLSDWVSFAIEDLAIPTVCLGLGFWVLIVRTRDRLAWLLLVLLLSFSEMFGTAYAGAAGLFGRTDSLQPLLATYHVLFSNLFSAALLLFAVYFPEQLSADRRIPWIK